MKDKKSESVLQCLKLLYSNVDSRPACIKSDNGSEFTAQIIQDWA